MCAVLLSCVGPQLIWPQEADTTHRKSLTFVEFQHLVRLLKRRPELEGLYKRLSGEQALTFPVFEKFMKETQKVNISMFPSTPLNFLPKSTRTSSELKAVFEKYATVEIKAPVIVPAPMSVPPVSSEAPPSTTSAATTTAPAPSPASTEAPPSTASAATTTAPVPSPVPSTAPPSAATTTAPTPSPVPPTEITGPAAAAAPVAPPVVISPTLPNVAPSAGTSPTSPPGHGMSLENFSSFLISQDNGPTYSEINDMTQPMSDYFISTSHNTYLVGNQLMGVSTIEGTSSPRSTTRISCI